MSQRTFPTSGDHPHRPGRSPVGRRGWGLIQLLGALFAGSLVLGASVPLFLAAQREADIGMARAQMTATARELSARIKEDVRQATDVEAAAGGDELRLTQARVDQPAVRDRITYRRTAAGLVREVRPGDRARAAERSVYGRPLSTCRFTRQRQGVSAKLVFNGRVSGRTVRYTLECAATPRSAL
ncbi:MAG: hypothetical protein ACO1SX_27630 [Actinomycetota bacterium]